MPGLTSRCGALGLAPALFVAAVAMVVAGCGGQGSGAHAGISGRAALTKLYDAIDARPSWATPRDSAAARANITYVPGANARCGPDDGSSGPDFERYVCSLRYIGDGGQPQWLWFREKGDGSDVVPRPRRSSEPSSTTSGRMSFADSRRRSRRRADLFERLVRLEQAVQPRVRGTACDGSHGMEHATPATSVVTAGNYLTAGPGTSCATAQVVATALGDSSTPQSTVLSLPSRTSRRRLTLRCQSMSRLGPVKCAGAGGIVVYAGSYDAPLPPSN